MFKGFYNLTSGMMTQGRYLDAIANNMTNVTTTGYKSDQFTASTFEEVLISRVGNKDKSGAEVIGSSSYILAPSQMYTDYSQGILESTGLPLDFAISGDGFFAIQQEDGVAYTRNGSFMLDDEGYLYLSGQGRVLDSDGNEIQLYTDDIEVDTSGIIRSQGYALAQLGVYSFEDLEQLTRNDQGLFVTDQQPLSTEGVVAWQTKENSNVDLSGEMVAMISAQRAYQSAAQVTKMYDQLMTQATQDIGKA